MTPERYQEFVTRIEDEANTILINHYTENPEFSHIIRLTSGISILAGYAGCVANRQHWNCLSLHGRITHYLFALAHINPNFVESLYTDFKEDFHEMIPEGVMLYKFMESHEFPPAGYQPTEQPDTPPSNDIC